MFGESEQETFQLAIVMKMQWQYSVSQLGNVIRARNETKSVPVFLLHLGIPNCLVYSLPLKINS